MNSTPRNENLIGDTSHQGVDSGNIDNLTPLYNSKLVLVYIDFLQRHYPNIDIDELLEDAGMTRLELEDPAHWFNQKQIDQFHALINEKTKNEKISRDVGRYAISSDNLGLIKQIAVSFMNPISVYSLIGKLYPLVSRAVKIETRRIGDTEVEISAVPYLGVKEKPYQCLNRTGSFEGIGKHFSDRKSVV